LYWLAQRVTTPESLRSTDPVRAMTQVVSRRPLTAEVRVRARVIPCGICGGQSGTGTDSSKFFYVLLSISFHRGSPHSYIIWGKNNKTVGGHSSETQSHPIDMTTNIYLCCRQALDANKIYIFNVIKRVEMHVSVNF
jgi:hypothetical protein